MVSVLPATLPATIAEAARRFGERTAYITEAGWSISYADIDRVSDEVAAGLAARGLGEGDVLALVLPPGPEYLLAYCAAAKVGAITAGVNDRLSERERTAVLDLAGPKLVIDAPPLRHSKMCSPTSGWENVADAPRRP
jgi:acyl-CoA synthetase (AMP-forming)/AMP-acid ligase II